MEQILNIDDLLELEKYVASQDEDLLRTSLTEEYLRLVEYKDAIAWNRLVRICEVFSIIGWGDLERVNAICTKSLNQWHTQLENKYREPRFLRGNWLKRKSGYVLFNPSYYHSPDKPDIPSVDWQSYPKVNEIVCAVHHLANQRNRQKMSPFSFGGIFVADSPVKSDMLFLILHDLRKLLDYNLRPDLYGEGIESIAIRYVTAKPDEKGMTRFEHGTYYPQKCTFGCDVFIGGEFADLSVSQRKEVLRELLLDVLDSLKDKASRKELNYDVNLLTEDALIELGKWMEAK
jgi:hypothetical protein